MTHATNIYWIEGDELTRLTPELERADIALTPVKKTACQTLNASDAQAFYAPPEIWSGMCRRQGSWYRASARAGLTLLVSSKPLPACFEPYREATIAASDFAPPPLPDAKELRELVDGEHYQGAKPEGWEDISFKDGVLSNLFFTLTGFWGWGDNLQSKWLSQRANHANFLSRRYTAEVDGEQVPYSVTNNDGVCSSCAEFFDVVGSGERKMVRACPGSVVFADLERGTYYDVVPLRRSRHGDVARGPGTVRAA